MTCANVYIEGASVVLLVECRQYGSATLVDPTTIIVRVKPPTAAEVTYTFGVDANLTRQAGKPAGAFQCRITANEPSTDDSPPVDWLWRWEATGSVVAVAEGYFRVKASSFP